VRCMSRFVRVEENGRVEAGIEDPKDCRYKYNGVCCSVYGYHGGRPTAKMCAVCGGFRREDDRWKKHERTGRL